MWIWKQKSQDLFLLFFLYKEFALFPVVLSIVHLVLSIVRLLFWFFIVERVVNYNPNV